MDQLLQPAHPRAHQSRLAASAQEGPGQLAQRLHRPLPGNVPALDPPAIHVVAVAVGPRVLPVAPVAVTWGGPTTAAATTTTTTTTTTQPSGAVRRESPPGGLHVKDVGVDAPRGEPCRQGPREVVGQQRAEVVLDAGRGEVPGPRGLPELPVVEGEDAHLTRAPLHHKVLQGVDEPLEDERGQPADGRLVILQGAAAHVDPPEHVVRTGDQVEEVPLREAVAGAAEEAQDTVDQTVAMLGLEASKELGDEAAGCIRQRGGGSSQEGQEAVAEKRSFSWRTVT